MAHAHTHRQRRPVLSRDAASPAGDDADADADAAPALRCEGTPLMYVGESYGGTSCTALPSTSWVPPPLVRRTHRRQAFVWTKVALYCACVFAKYSGYDAPAVAAVPLQRDAGMSAPQLGVMFAMYSAPNFVLPFVFGLFAAQRALLWPAVLVTVTVATVGAVLFLLGVVVGSFPLLCAARFLYGGAVESFFVGGDALLTQWLAASSHTLGFALRQAAGETGSLLTYYAGPALRHRWKLLFVIDAALSATGAVGVYVAFGLDRRRARDAATRHAVRFAPLPARQHVSNAVAVLRGMPAVLWRVTAMIVLFQTSFYTFCSFAPAVFEHVYHQSHSGANFLAGTLSAASLTLSPLSGWLLDTYGRHTATVAACFLASCAALVVLVLQPGGVSPWVPTCVFAACYSVLPNALWALLARHTTDAHFPVVYGATACAANAATTLSQLAVGAVAGHSYVQAFWVLVAVLAGGSVLAVAAVAAGCATRQHAPANVGSAAAHAHARPRRHQSFCDAAAPSHAASALLLPTEAPASPTSVTADPHALAAVWDALPAAADDRGH